MSFREEIDALNARFLSAVRRRDAAGACADAYTEDAVLLAPGTEPVRGRAAITTAILGYWSAGFVPTGITTLSAEVDGSLGYAIETVESSSGAGIALLVVKREGGAWKVCAEAFIGAKRMSCATDRSAVTSTFRRLPPILGGVCCARCNVIAPSFMLLHHANLAPPSPAGPFFQAISSA